jgi:hypothetical protein
MAFSSDGLKIMTPDGTGMIWEAKSGNLLHVLDAGRKALRCSNTRWPRSRDRRQFWGPSAPSTDAGPSVSGR